MHSGGIVARPPPFCWICICLDRTLLWLVHGLNARQARDGLHQMRVFIVELIQTIDATSPNTETICNVSRTESCSITGRLTPP